jgi:hypothetical protein
MIARHIPMRSIRKSDFVELVNYLTDEQEKFERVGDVTITNCHSDRPDVAAIEAVNTQGKNTRARSDKTFHLLVSFPVGETPGATILRAIENRLCEGLGFGEHQRISVVHTDTDNLHIHISINKIHPTRYTIHEPYYSHKSLGALCEKLEQEYGLTRVNHKANYTRSENHAADMESHAGIESLIGWIKRECIDQIKAAQSWEGLHKVMQENDLLLHERGNGLVITAKDGTTIKASSLGRDLSKKQLESRFGVFVPSSEKMATERPFKSYEQKPLRSRVDTVELYARYKNETEGMTATRKQELNWLVDHKNRNIEDAKRSGRLKRAAVKLIGGSRFEKRFLYSGISKSLKDDILKINQRYISERQAIYDKHKRRSWADWLKAMAISGDSEALNALRARDMAHGLNGDTVSGSGRQSTHKLRTEQDNITKKGTIIYRVGRTIIRDDGQRLKVSRGVTQTSLHAVLVMAIERYGEHIKVNGTDDFKEQVVQAAAAAKLPITFDDPTLERRRQELIQITLKEQNNEQRNVRGRTDRTSNGGTRLRTSRINTTVAGDSRPGGRTVLPERFALKPNIGRVGRKPPPESQNRLRRLSELGVVRFASRSEVLLSGNVPGVMEQQRTQPDNRLRRDIPGAGTITPGQAAADKYIAERENKRLIIGDITKHTRYNHFDSGDAVFVGIREVDKHFLALLRNDKDEVMVLPIDESTSRRLKRVAVGDFVTVSANGSIKTKGRRR